MKYVSLVLSIMLLCGIAMAKDYTVSVDETIIPYFEGAFEGEEVTPEEWLGMQAVNLADQVINREYIEKTVRSKTRQEKIDAIKVKEVVK